MMHNWFDIWLEDYRVAFLSYAWCRGQLTLADADAWIAAGRDRIEGKHRFGDLVEDPDDAAYADVRACEKEFSNLRDLDHERPGRFALVGSTG